MPTPPDSGTRSSPSGGKVPWPFDVLARWSHALTFGFPGGPRFLKMAWVINLQKGGTAIFVLVLMTACNEWGTAAWIYLALHGTYGICWLLKDAIFPDAQWEQRVTWGGAINAWVLVLGLYWIFPVLLITDVLGPRPDPSPAVLAAAVALHTVGVVMMMGADTQKHFVLKARPGLIDDGWFARIRHPNYAGEMMLYAAYALLVRHWIAWAVLAWVWGLVFSANIARKEASMSRHAGWWAYRRRAGLLWPRRGAPRKASSGRGDDGARAGGHEPR